MPYSSELLFEKDLVKYLYTNCGWEKEVIKNPTEEDLIKNWANILYENNKDVDHLNGYPLTDSEMRQVITQIETLKTPYKLNSFINGKSVTIIRDNPLDVAHFGKPVTLKIYDRLEIAAGSSRYQIVEQPIFKTTNPVYPSRRGDVMLLINGMPVYHIELKRSDVSISHAQTQIEKYMVNNAFTGIFSLVQIFIAMNPEEAVYFANPGPNAKFNPLYYFHWTDANNEYINEWHAFAHSLLSIPRAHEMIGFYTVADDSDCVLKVLRPYQVYAAETVSNKVSAAHWTHSEQRGGYVWHTTGSGKTLTSFKTAQLIASMSKADKVVFLIDRVELGEQSYFDYVHFANVDQNIYETSNTDALIRLLKSDESDEKVIVSSIQKMSRITPDNVPMTVINKIKEKKIVFIVDECHRDQSGDMHQTIEHNFPTAMFFGYTGTPDHQKTKQIFGDEKHRYTIAHGIRDKNVLPFDRYKVCIFDDYDLRKAVALKMCNVSTEEEALDDEKLKEIYLYFMNQTDKECTMLEVESKVPVSQFETQEYRESVVQDILNKWSVRSSGSTFHAIFATSSIEAAIEYYYLFAKEKSEGKHSLNITALFDPSDNNDDLSIFKMDGITEILTDYNNTFGKSYTVAQYPKFKKDLCLRLSHKEPYRKLEKEEQINIVIVVDQLLTGFDSKWVNTVYLDKVLRGKNFIQAASRTNRLFGPQKPHGIIVMYRYPHTEDELFTEAVNEFSGNKPFGVFVDNLEDNLNEMNFLFKEICNLFDAAGIKNFERIEENEGWKKQFAKLFSTFNNTLYSAKLQGFFWDTLHYEFEKVGSISIVDFLIDETTYSVLVQRYKELFTRGGGFEEPPFEIDPHIIEIKTDSITSAYINSRFKQYMRDLSGGDSSAKEKALNELHKSFSSLSQEEQSFARQFLNDLENGLVIDPNKDFTDYITEYKTKAYNDKVHEIAEGLGINETKLVELINLHPVPATINAFNRYDELFSELDVDKAKIFLEAKLGVVLTKKREIKMQADEFLRKVILQGI